jgi:mRNA interferase RelE/StbE
MPGNDYNIEYLEVVVRKDIPNLPKTAKKLVKKGIEEKLATDPITFGKPLRYSLKGHRRLRIGNYRVVYRIDPKKHQVLIVAIKHQKDIYES